MLRWAGSGWKITGIEWQIEASVTAQKKNGTRPLID